MSKKRRILISLAALGTFGLIGLGLTSMRVEASGRQYIVSAADAAPADAAMVLGAYVWEDTPSGVLSMRLDTARKLYVAGKVKKILVTGDHGKDDYDEVNAMRGWLEKRGVPAKDIFMDHAGFNTYDSMYRARDVFGVRTLIVVTQDWHLPRALYIARTLGLEAQGVAAVDIGDAGPYTSAREMMARVKAYFDLTVERQPKFLGARIPISGDGRATQD